MVTKSAKYISDILVYGKIVDLKERSIYQYGLELLISTFINFLLVIVIGSYIGSPVQGIIYFLVLATLRTQAGGYHAPSYFTCGMLYSVLFVITIYMTQLLYYAKVNLVILTLILLINISLFLFFAPVLHKRKVSKKGKEQAKIKAVIRGLVWTIITICLYYVNLYWAYTIVVSITSISVFMFVGKGMEEKEYGKAN